jgi:hypothetical protein
MAMNKFVSVCRDANRIVALDSYTKLLSLLGQKPHQMS